MKYFCYFFSLYFLALAVMPCTDNHDVTKSASSSFPSISSQKSTECPHGAEQDPCSPFCICSCCGVTIISNQLPKLSLIKPIFHNFKEKQTFLFSPNLKSNFSNTIFIPPQVA